MEQLIRIHLDSSIVGRQPAPILSPAGSGRRIDWRSIIGGRNLGAAGSKWAARGPLWPPMFARPLWPLLPASQPPVSQMGISPSVGPDCWPANSAFSKPTRANRPPSKRNQLAKRNSAGYKQLDRRDADRAKGTNICVCLAGRMARCSLPAKPSGCKLIQRPICINHPPANSQASAQNAAKQTNQIPSLSNETNHCNSKPGRPHPSAAIH